MEAMVELREELKDFIEIQIVAFPQEGILSYPNGVELLQKSVDMGADAVGAIPHFEYTREYSVESLNIAMKMAEKHGKLVDVHCDEIDDEASRGLETVATRALESEICLRRRGTPTRPARGGRNHLHCRRAHRYDATSMGAKRTATEFVLAQLLIDLKNM